MGIKLLNKIKPVFDTAGAKLFIIETTFAGHARELINQMDMSGYDGFLAIGGEGTYIGELLMKLKDGLRLGT